VKLTVFEKCQATSETADALIWQTAQSFGATLYTQDGGLKAMTGVQFKLK
jgi:hypothetical protein